MVGFLEYLRRNIMASRVVSLWMTGSIFIKQGNDVYFEVGFLYTGHRKVCGRDHIDKLFGVFKYNKDSNTVELFDNFCYDYTERMKRLVIVEIKKLIENNPSVLDRKEKCSVYYDIGQWGRINLSG